MGRFAKQGGDPIWQQADASLADDETEALQQASHLVLQVAAQRIGPRGAAVLALRTLAALLISTAHRQF